MHTTTWFQQLRIYGKHCLNEQQDLSRLRSGLCLGQCKLHGAKQRVSPHPFILWCPCFTGMQPSYCKLHFHLFCQLNSSGLFKIHWVWSGLGKFRWSACIWDRVKETWNFMFASPGFTTEFGLTTSLSSHIVHYMSFSCVIKKIKEGLAFNL